MDPAEIKKLSLQAAPLLSMSCSVVSVVLPMFSCVLCPLLRYPKYLSFVFFISIFIRAI